MIEKIKEDLFCSYEPNKVPIWVYLFFVHIISAIVTLFSISYFSSEQKEQYFIGVIIWVVLAIGWIPVFRKHIKSNDFKKQEENRLEKLKEVLIANNMVTSKDILFLFRLAEDKTKYNVFNFTGISVLILYLLNPIYSTFLNKELKLNILAQLWFSVVVFIIVVISISLYSSLYRTFNDLGRYKILKNDLGRIRLEMKSKKLKH